MGADLAWPVVVGIILVVFLFLYRSPLSAFISRSEHWEVTSKGVIARAATAQKAEAPAPAAVEELLRAFESPLIIQAEANVRQDLERRGLAGTPQALDVLVRHLAAVQVFFMFEWVYSAIFGGQLSILQTLNTSGADGVPYSTLETIMEPLRLIFPEIAAMSITEYTEFLVTVRLAERKPDRLAITLGGREFLAYLIRTGKSLTKIL